MILETQRLILRRWRADDVAALHAINTDPKVMEYYPALFSLEETQKIIQRFEKHFDEHGFGMWALEFKATNECIGFLGLQMATFTSIPCVEIGYRIASPYWGQGLAGEGSTAVLNFAARELKLKEVCAVAVKENLKSRRVMDKLGFSYEPSEDFDHPKMSAKHLKAHVLYRKMLSNLGHS